MVDVIEDKPTVKVEVASFAVYCARCSNSRHQIRPGSSNCFDLVPCERCRPAAHEAAMGS